MPNCPGAKLSGCQIVHFYYVGAKLSSFIILAPNCPPYYLGAKLSGVKLSGAKLSGAKLSYNLSIDFLIPFPWRLQNLVLQNIKIFYPVHTTWQQLRKCGVMEGWSLFVSTLSTRLFSKCPFTPLRWINHRLQRWTLVLFCFFSSLTQIQCIAIAIHTVVSL